jgi:gas vesicle protein
MGHNHLHAKEFVIGAAVGSLLGSVAALLVAPKAGQKLRADICDAYCDFTDKTEDLAKRGRHLAKNFGCQTCSWANKAKSAVDGAKKMVKGWVSEEEEGEETTRDLLIGGLVGGVLGAAIGLLLAPKSGEQLRQDLVETYDDISEKTQDFADHVTKKGKTFAKTARSKTNKWINLAKDIIDDLTEETEEKAEDWLERVKGLVNNKCVNDVLGWAQLGYRVWEGIQSKR